MSDHHELARHGIDWTDHPVDVMKALADGMGAKVCPVWERQARAICDAPARIRPSGKSKTTVATGPKRRVTVRTGKPQRQRVTR